VPGDRLAGEVGVKLDEPQVTIGRTVRALIVGRHHPDQVAGVVDQGSGLDPAESRGGGDLTVRREVRVGPDIGDDGLRALPGRSSAHGPVLAADDGEVIQELRAESGLGDQPHHAGGRVEELDVPVIRPGERHQSVQHPRKQGAQLRDRAEVLREAVQACHRVRLGEAEADGGGEVFGPPGGAVLAVLARRGHAQGIARRGAVSRLRLLQRIRYVLDPVRHHVPIDLLMTKQPLVPSSAFGRAGAHPPFMRSREAAPRRPADP